MDPHNKVSSQVLTFCSSFNKPSCKTHVFPASSVCLYLVTFYFKRESFISLYHVGGAGHVVSVYIMRCTHSELRAHAKGPSASWKTQSPRPRFSLKSHHSHNIRQVRAGHNLISIFFVLKRVLLRPGVSKMAEETPL